MDRQAEIEAKRAKIAELRRKRKEAAEQIQKNEEAPISSRETIDNLVESLVGSRTVSGEALRSPTESDALSSAVVFSTVLTPVFDVAPVENKEIITYNKEVQTSEEWNDGDIAGLSLSEVESGRKSIPNDPNTDENIPGHEVQEVYKKKIDQEELYLENKLRQLELDSEENANISHSTQLEEKPSVDQHDVFSRSFFEDSDNEEADVAQEAFQLAKLISDDTAGRAITSIDWSPKYSELVAAAYTEKPNDPKAPRGLVLIWNLRSPETPEFTLTASSDILNVRFSPFNKKIVFGAAYNGQVFSWNLRSGAKPVLATPLTGAGHSHPVYSLEITGTQNASTLFSASTDGTLCTWTPDLLANPQERISLMSSAVMEVAPTTLAVSPRDPTIFYVGTEENIIYQGNRFNHAGAKAGLDMRTVYKGHRAPLTKIDIHAVNGPVNLSDYMLSAGFDWTINIWKLRQPGGLSSSASGTLETNTPILSIQREDVVYDVSWNPHFPGVFGSVDGTGYLEIWDLNNDLDSPLARLKPTQDLPILPTSLSNNHLNRPLNKICWDKASESRRVAVGGLDGAVTVFEINPKLLPTPELEDWKTTKITLSRLEE